MNLFRPYRAAEPERDETGRLVGIDRYQEVLGLGWKRFFLSGLLTMAGCLPLTLGVGYAVLSKSALVLLPASLLGGAAAGPFIACLYDTILRALRAAPGRWWANYQKAFAQNWRGSLVPGALTGLFLGCAVFAAMLLFAWATAFPGAGTIAVFLFSCLLFLILTTLYWPQLVLFEQSAALRLRNALLFTVKYFWRVLGVAALQLVWWLCFVLFAPLSLLLLPLAGVWFILYATLFILYDPLNKALGIEEQIARRYPDQTPRYD